MEPSGFAPRSLGEFEGRRQRDLIAAYRRRIGVARQVLRDTEVPGLRLGMYQVIVPDGRGESSEGFERRMCGYLEAGRQGMYDELDFICPVMYQRFGVDDTTPEMLHKWVTAATRQGIEGSLDLTRRNGSTIPLVPILSFWVFNGRSASNRQACRPTSWLANYRSCKAPEELLPRCSGRVGRPRKRWSRPKSRSSRSTSTSSCSASELCLGQGAPRKRLSPTWRWKERVMVAVDLRIVDLVDERPLAGARVTVTLAVVPRFPIRPDPDDPIRSWSSKQTSASPRSSPRP